MVYTSAIKSHTAYGYQHNSKSSDFLLGFNGEVFHFEFGGYLLGNGYRIFTPIQMRFHSPDISSPFHDGGINAYAYCAGDPVNFIDPTGKSRRNYFLHRFIPKSKQAAPRKEASPLLSSLFSPQTGKAKPARNFITLKDLSSRKDINYKHYNDYSRQQLVEKARRFNDLLYKEDLRAKSTRHETSKHFQAVSRYRNNLDALEVQMNMRDPDYMFELAKQGRNFWDMSDSGTPMPSSTASTGLLRHNQQAEQIRRSSVLVPFRDAL